MENSANLFGALALAITGAQLEAVQKASGLGGSGPAAIVSIGIVPQITIGELARITGVTHSVAVRLVETLVERGWVSRSFGEDKREVQLTLSRSGLRMRRSILAAREAVLDSALKRLTKSDRKDFARLASLLLINMTTSRKQADFICRICDEHACGGDLCPVECRARLLEHA